MGKISDYFAIEIYHERYMFSAETCFYRNEDLETVIKDCGYEIEQLEDREDGYYMIDLTHRRPINDYEYETDRVKGVEHISPEVLLIIDLNQRDINKNEFHEFVFGKTNTKFGLLDIIKEDK